jgi:hypothetical protein
MAGPIEGFDIQTIGRLFTTLQGSLKDVPERVRRIQEELARERVTGEAGGGTVRVVMSGSAEVIAVHIEPGFFDPRDTGAVGDLIRVATNDAFRRARELARTRLGGVLGGLDPTMLFR